MGYFSLDKYTKHGNLKCWAKKQRKKGDFVEYNYNVFNIIKEGVSKMTFFSNLRDKVSGLAKSAAQKSGEVMEITKLNMNIKTEKEGIRDLYIKLGEYCFLECAKGEITDPQVAKWVKQIKTHQDNIAFYNEKINEIKEMLSCPACGHQVAKTETFCGRCGIRIQGEQEIEIPKENEE